MKCYIEWVTNWVKSEWLVKTTMAAAVWKEEEEGGGGRKHIMIFKELDHDIDNGVSEKVTQNTGVQHDSGHIIHEVPFDVWTCSISNLNSLWLDVV